MTLPLEEAAPTAVRTLRKGRVAGVVSRGTPFSEVDNLSGRRLLTHRAALNQTQDSHGSSLRTEAAAHSLARTLAAATDVHGIGNCVLRHVRRVMSCRLASVAAPGGDGDLAIVASHGDPHALVEHVRIPIGKGPIGTVYRTGRALLIRDISTVPGLRARRLRFATDSFMAVPLKFGDEVVAVVCVSDRIDGGPFTRRDLRILRRVTAPAALAFGLEAARREARANARAAMIDPVSGLFNRRYFQLRLEEEMQRASRHGTLVGVLMLDIDNFKGINDQFGHLVGDMVIRDVAGILRESVRSFDMCARFGGDEFVVIMADADEERLHAVAERIRRNIDAYRSADRGLAGVATTVSIGVTLTCGRRPEEVVECADQALYAAKNGGKNQVVATSVTSSLLPPQCGSDPGSAAPRQRTGYSDASPALPEAGERCAPTRVPRERGVGRAGFAGVRVDRQRARVEERGRAPRASRDVPADHRRRPADGAA